MVDSNASLQGKTNIDDFAVFKALPIGALFPDPSPAPGFLQQVWHIRRLFVKESV